MKVLVTFLLVALYTVVADDAACFYDSYSLVSDTGVAGVFVESLVGSLPVCTVTAHKPDLQTSASDCKAYCKNVSVELPELGGQLTSNRWQFTYKSSVLSGCYCLNCVDIDESDTIPLTAGERLVGGLIDAADDCFWDRYRYTKQIWHNNTIESPLACRAMCETIPGAQNFQFFELMGGITTNFWGNCWCGLTKDVPKKYMKGSSNTKLIGGPVIGAPALDLPDCYNKSMNYPGADLYSHKLEIYTAQFCQVKCQQVAACKGFSWTPGSCWLKDATPALEPWTGVISGPKYC